MHVVSLGVILLLFSSNGRIARIGDRADLGLFESG